VQCKLTVPVPLELEITGVFVLDELSSFLESPEESESSEQLAKAQSIEINKSEISETFFNF